MMRRRLETFAVLMAVFGVAQGQTVLCGEAFTLTEDTVLCEPVNEITVEASTVWEWLSIEWQLSSGALLLDDSTVFVNTSGSELLRVTAELRMPNAIVNGDFSQGNTGFTSNLIYSPVSVLPPGTFTVNVDPANVHPSFISCGDHTTGDGPMLIVNGSLFPNQNVWCQTVEVEPGATYELSYWAASLDDKALPELLFRIDGNNFGDVLIPGPATCEWIQANLSWTAGPAQTSAQICIRNATGANIGNDFVIDDIAMTRVCTIEDSVRIDYQALEVLWIDTLLCAGDAVLIGGNTYTQTTTDTLSLTGYRGCDSLVYISVIVVDPQLSLMADGSLDCTTGEVELTLLVSGASIGTSSIEWKDPTGATIPGANASTITTETPGIYTGRFVLDLGGGLCVREAIVEVTQDVTTPMVQLGPDRNLTCAMPELELTADVLQAGSMPVFHWMSLHGSDPGPGSGATIILTEEGMYILEVLNPDNGCSGADTIVITDLRENLMEPVIVMGRPFCLPASGWLEVIDIDGGIPPYTMQVQGPDGLVLMGGPRFESLPPGDYLVTISDASGCDVVVAVSVGPVILPTINLPAELQAGGLDGVTVRPQLSFPDSMVVAWEWSASGATLDCADCPEAIASGLGDGVVEVCVITVGGCRVCATVRIDFERDIQVFFPTAFSPNGDGINDAFQPFVAPGLVRSYLRMEIYDRWGNQLWLWQGGPGQDETPAWDGEAKGKRMMPGVYVFVLDLEFVDGTQNRYRGEVQLIR